MKYYSVLRPIGIGTLPRSAEAVLSKIVNFDDKTFVEEINRAAWGYIEVTEPIPVGDANGYDLVSDIISFDDLARKYAKEMASGWKGKEALEEALSMSYDDLLGVLND